MTQASIEKPPTRVQQLVARLFGFAAADIDELRKHLYAQAVEDYSTTLLEEAISAGYDVRSVQVTDDLVLRKLQERADFAAQSIARSYNRDLVKEIARIASDVPTANRYVYAKRLEAWETRRMASKIESIAVTEFGAVMHEARRDFLERNPGLGGVARVRPGTAAEPICQSLVARGEMPVLEALSLQVPAHVNCVHYVEIAWASDTAAQKSWVVSKAEAERPKQWELWLGGGAPGLPEDWTLQDLVSLSDITGGKGRDRDSDAQLGALAKLKGYDGLPKVLSKQDFDAALTAGAREVWRGVTNPAFAQQFKAGAYFPGKGVYGNGTYATVDRQVALDYARAAGESGLLRIAVPKDAKLLDYDELTTIRKNVEAMARRGRREMTWGMSREQMDAVESKIEAAMELVEDHGRVALLLGYDGIDVKHEGYVVLLNRSILMVQQ